MILAASNHRRVKHNKSKSKNIVYGMVPKIFLKQIAYIFFFWNIFLVCIDVRGFYCFTNTLLSTYASAHAAQKLGLDCGRTQISVRADWSGSECGWGREQIIGDVKWRALNKARVHHSTTNHPPWPPTTTLLHHHTWPPTTVLDNPTTILDHQPSYLTTSHLTWQLTNLNMTTQPNHLTWISNPPYLTNKPSDLTTNQHLTWLPNHQTWQPTTLLDHPTQPPYLTT